MMPSELSELSELSDFHKGAFAPAGSDKTQTRFQAGFKNWLHKLASKAGFTQDLLYVHMAAMNPQKIITVATALKTLKVLRISTPILVF